MPSGTWLVTLRKLSGPAGAVTLRFRVGSPPGTAAPPDRRPRAAASGGLWLQPVPIARINELGIYYEVRGDGEPVLLIGGLRQRRQHVRRHHRAGSSRATV